MSVTHTLSPITEFVNRRQQLLAQLPSNSVAIIPAGKEVTRSNDTEYLFCQNKNFYYLTGFNEPDALLVLVKASSEQGSVDQSILFCRDKDPLQEVWHGKRIGPSVAKQDYQFSACFTVQKFEKELPELLNDKDSVYVCQGENEALEQQILQCFKQLKAASRQGKKSPKALVDCTAFIHEMRLIKSSAELTIMRQANVISGQAHQRAMAKTHDGKFEYQIEAELLHEFARHGARFPAYNSIVAGGDNANILHYTENSDVLTNGDLLLIDAGAELAGYAADITRTFPVSGKFSEPQKTLYELVLLSQNKAIEAVKPNNTLGELNTITNKILTEGLYELGILQGDLPSLLAQNACKQYFIHGLGHWLGLDVHDVGDYAIDENRKQSRAFEPGMVMTIEPGIYIPLNDESVDEKWRGIAIRIEDNILVTETGYENLTVNSPKTVSDIETLMANART